MQKEKDELVYTRRIDAEIAQIYASHKCNKCYGRGLKLTEVGAWTTHANIRNGYEVEQVLDYCDCVHRNRKFYS